MSNVPKSKRNVSSMEYLNLALKIKKNITLLLLRDFGVKDRVWDLELIGKRYKMPEEDIAQLEEICGRNGITSPLRFMYPEWFLDKKRDEVIDYVDNLYSYAAQANAIYPYVIEEADERRLLLSQAIAQAKALMLELQFLQSILPVNCEKYVPYIEMLTKEVTLLKGQRKYVNKIRAKIITRSQSG